MKRDSGQIYDIFVVGGGINGLGVARDAAGRGYSVCLCEMNDFASGTSSNSTKLIHGGLRYLEYYKFRLVQESLKEREVLLKMAPHIIWPMRFILPHSKGMRPAWLLRLGLALYDHLGFRKILSGTSSVNLHTGELESTLKNEYKFGYEYSDCWIEDSSLVVLNARDAEARGAQILPRTKVTEARRYNDLWHITINDTPSGEPRVVRARMLVNAGGPWVANILRHTAGINATDGVRLVRGSHIVTKKLFDHEKCYFFQGTDGRIIFAIPYESDFTLIGTTDADHDDPSTPAECSPQERDYLLQFASRYFDKPGTKEDVVWSYSGVRPLYDDGAASATAASCTRRFFA